MDQLRDRIAAVQAAHCQMPWGCLCGWKYAPLLDDSHFDHVADAVIEALGADCIYRYVCANCGDFWFDKSERMQRFALLHSRSHLAVIQETKQCEKAGGGFSQWHRYVTDWTTDE